MRHIVAVARIAGNWLRAFPSKLARVLKDTKSMLRAFPSSLAEAVRLHMSPSFADIRSIFRYHMKLLHTEEAGFSTGKMEALFIGIILLVIVIQFLFQQGLPMVLTATSNTTAMESAGATAAQLSWVSYIGSAIVIFLLVALLIMGIRTGLGSSGGGGGGKRGGRRRRR